MPDYVIQFDAGYYTIAAGGRQRQRSGLKLNNAATRSRDQLAAACLVAALVDLSFTIRGADRRVADFAVAIQSPRSGVTTAIEDETNQREKWYNLARKLLKEFKEWKVESYRSATYKKVS